jgi:hypothetical protein
MHTKSEATTISMHIRFKPLYLKSMCKEEDKPNHIRVKVFDKDCNGYNPIK